MPRIKYPSFCVLIAALFCIGPISLATGQNTISDHGQATVLEKIDFNRDVRPILSDKCFYCHGPDPKKREAGFRLDIEEEAKEDAIVEHDAANSELILRIISDDVDERMPPPDSPKQLTPTEIETLKLWIDQGAPYSRHWSFVPVSKPKLPTFADKSKLRIQNEVDAFIAEKLIEKNFSQSRPATKEILIRRVTFDLTGLPPTLDEIDKFLADDSTKAFGKVVDRLLESPAYGQRMAAIWLDAARYSDTYGYQVDRDRFVWPWRDWVIRAFNDNKPYDEFITEQLAGDLLPNASRDQILATTFNRLHPQKVEGGSVEEEFRIEYVADRAQTVATSMMGLTMECARCHDHKFDPISQKEYYQLTAFFDNIDEAGLYSVFTNSIPTPTLKLPTDEQSGQLKPLQNELNLLEKQLVNYWEDNKDEMEVDFNHWLQENRNVVSPKPILHLDFEDYSSDKSKGGNESASGKFGKAIKLTGDHPYTTKVGNFARHEPFSVSLWINTPDEKERAVVFHRSRAWTDAASRGYELLIEDGRLSAALIHFWPGNAIRVITENKIPVDQWIHVAITYDGSSTASGLKIYVDGKPATTQTNRDYLTREIRGGGGDNITIGERFRDRGFTNSLVDEFMVFDRELCELEVQQLVDPELFKKLWTTEWNSLENEQKVSLQQLFLVTSSPASYGRLVAEIQAKRKSLFELQNKVPEIMVMRELDSPRQTYLLERGVYDAKKTRVQALTPAALPLFDDKLPRNRLGLARWLTSPNHPLTSRVAVNRVWQMLFGRGLVSTPEDFGSQGKPPSHPELLDYLANDFVDNGWDTKRMIKTIVMSHTYQQSSEYPHRDDPENIYLSYSPRYRLSAEMLRDNALAVSGLLVDKVGGPPVRPYEVTESFKPVAADKGEGLYRRSLYTYWKRTGPAPAMMALDAAKRDVCQVRRERTSGPLQAFILQNSPQFVEAARGLSANAFSKTESIDPTIPMASLGDEISNQIFRTLTGRYPDEKESAVLKKLYKSQLKYFADDVEACESFLKVGQMPIPKKMDHASLAALTVVTTTIMNFDHSVIRR